MCPVVGRATKLEAHCPVGSVLVSKEVLLRCRQKLVVDSGEDHLSLNCLEGDFSDGDDKGEVVPPLQNKFASVLGFEAHVLRKVATHRNSRSVPEGCLNAVTVATNSQSQTMEVEVEGERAPGGSERGMVVEDIHSEWSQSSAGQWSESSGVAAVIASEEGEASVAARLRDLTEEHLALSSDGWTFGSAETAEKFKEFQQQHEFLFQKMYTLLLFLWCSLSIVTISVTFHNANWVCLLLILIAASLFLLTHVLLQPAAHRQQLVGVLCIAAPVFYVAGGVLSPYYRNTGPFLVMLTSVGYLHNPLLHPGFPVIMMVITIITTFSVVYVLWQSEPDRADLSDFWLGGVLRGGIGGGAAVAVTALYRRRRLRVTFGISLIHTMAFELAESKQQRLRKVVAGLIPTAEVDAVVSWIMWGRVGPSITRQYDDVVVSFVSVRHPTALATGERSAAGGDGALNAMVNVADTVVRAVQAEGEGLTLVKILGDLFLLAVGLDEHRPREEENLVHHAGHDRKDRCLDISPLLQLLLRLPSLVSRAGLKKSIWGDAQVTAGVHRGPLVGAVIGYSGLMFDVFGSTVNVASRLHSTASRETIRFSSPAMELVQVAEHSLSSQLSVPSAAGHAPLNSSKIVSEKLSAQEVALKGLEDARVVDYPIPRDVNPPILSYEI